MARPALTSVAAIFGVLAASTCCLPILPFVAAAGLAGGSTLLWMLRPYLLGASILLVAFGFYQAFRAKQCNRRPGAMSSLLLWLPAAVVAMSIFFPQAASAVLYISGGNQSPPGQPSLSDITAQTESTLKTSFNAAGQDVRLLLFLSPT
jgi:hypothetical protein